MAKLSFASLSSIILFLLFIAFTGNGLVKVSGEDFHEDLGACDAVCLARCKAAHPNGRGSCAGAQVCKCLFDTCVETIGPPGTCDPNKCKSDCSARHPNRRADGYCYKVRQPPGSDCLCDYDC